MKGEGMDSLKFLVNSDKVHWDLPQSALAAGFSAENNVKIPYTTMGAKEICRYERNLGEVTVFVTPVFKPNLISFRGIFEQGGSLEGYKKVLDFIVGQAGEPVYMSKEGWRGTELAKYPCSVWILPDAILEIGIHDDNYVPIGYVRLTNKGKYKEVYTEKYLSQIGWKPPKQL